MKNNKYHIVGTIPKNFKVKYQICKNTFLKYKFNLFLQLVI